WLKLQKLIRGSRFLTLQRDHMRKLLLLSAILVAAILVIGAAKTSAPTSPAKFANAIDPLRIRQHVRFLSHDLLEGRGTGQRGGDIAGEYIATQFAVMGLKPAGENGSYMQKVPMVGVTTLPETTFSLVPQRGDARNLKFLDEYVGIDQTQQPKSSVDADIVYVGYGIEAPEYEWHD